MAETLQVQVLLRSHKLIWEGKLSVIPRCGDDVIIPPYHARVLLVTHRLNEGSVSIILDEWGETPQEDGEKTTPPKT